PAAGEVSDGVYNVAAGFWEAALLDDSAVGPALAIKFAGANVVLSWSSNATGFFVEQNLSPTQPRGWLAATAPVVGSKGLQTVTIPSSGGARFFRLTQTPSPLLLTLTRAGKNAVLSWPGV